VLSIAAVNRCATQNQNRNQNQIRSEVEAWRSDFAVVIVVFIVVA
jgi:hypothetical protein